jgi:hypothetical protein
MNSADGARPVRRLPVSPVPLATGFSVVSVTKNCQTRLPEAFTVLAAEVWPGPVLAFGAECCTV